MFSRNIEPSSQTYKDLEANFKEEYLLEKSKPAPQQEAMAVDNAAAEKKADDDLKKAEEAKRQRVSEEDAAKVA